MSRPTRLVRTASAGLVDAGISSAGNFAVAWVAAQLLSLAAFGILASGLMVGVLLAGLSRVVFVETLVLRHSGNGRTRLDQEARPVLGMILTGSVVVGVLVVAVGLLPGTATPVRSVIVTLGCVLPLILLQDSLRWICYARGDVGNALLSTSIWTLGTLIGMAVLFGRGAVTAVSCLAVWGATAGLAAAVSVVRTHLTPVRPQSTAWMRGNVSLSFRTAADYVLTQAVGQGGGLLIAAVAGAAAYGVLRVAQLPLALIPIMITGSVAVLQPAMLVHVARGEHRAARKLAGVATTGMAIAVLGMYAVTLIAGTEFMSRVFGPGWTEAGSVVPVVVAGAIGSCATAAYGPYLRSVNEIDYQVRIKVVVAPLVLLAIAALSAVHSTVGGAVAQAAGALLLAGLAVWRSRRAPRLLPSPAARPA